MANLRINLCGLTLKNPTVLAAGILGNTGEILKRISKHAGAVTTKSISLKPRDGHETPNIVELENKSLLNAMGLPNPGAENFLQELKIAKSGAESPIIVSCVGFSVDEFVKVAEKIGNLGDAVELDLSCPNTKGTLEFSQSPEVAAEVVSKVKKIVKKPVFAKLGPNVNKISEIAVACEKAGADGITAINTMPALAIDVETGKVILTNLSGGLSGAALRPVAVRCIYDIYENVRIPVIGTGGVLSGEDAAELMMAGATAVGMGTAAINEGPNAFKRISNELDKFLHRKGYKSAAELTGLAHKR
ncbi:TPA: dihydroorotate dehydrogenase [archaeon]|uniref:Dihydroorotate dehydrogenase n=1 Tax=Candidatus Naiadarchaeum limnaeum TaxID=2756139 RepID=A0A832V4J4_9ARCH|nr:dihydroorotate dehydrogenase [Candidatus Naiadarchaeales archaeon SRR2090153.bin1042]HIK00045.1 dihydroorotate dehydrogenase [Candidatus Naiadarchaeum limnaeum]